MPPADTPTCIRDSIVFIGGGNMARSLIAGLRRGGHPAALIAVAEPQAAVRDALAVEFGVAVAEHGHESVTQAELVVLAVKPQVMEAVCRELRPRLASGALVLSIAAGLPCAKLSEWLGTTAVVRCMPNTPALLGAGASGLFAPAQVSGAQRVLAQRVLDAAGVSVWVEDEGLMDVVTAISGSGPAYFFLLVQSLIEAGVQQGMPHSTAQTLACHTALGAARMLVESNEDAAELRRRVTSPGGTTDAAVNHFQTHGLPALVAGAVQAAVQRGRELADG
jgi:pyrroline-5-carboxylate reductase